MHFEWDDEKNQLNYEKHKLRFEEAAQIFHGPTLTTLDEREDYGEIRDTMSTSKKSLDELSVIAKLAICVKFGLLTNTSICPLEIQHQV